jgi:hypothetical protein
MGKWAEHRDGQGRAEKRAIEADRAKEWQGKKAVG